MEFSELCLHRYSVRSYKPNPINENELQTVLEAARLAPTAANRQPFQLIVIHTEGKKDQLQRIYDRDWFTQAPIIICAVGLPDVGWKRGDNVSYTYVDVAIAMDHLILAAAELNLGTCWIAAFNPDEARKVLGLPPEAEPIVFTPLGYPADQPKTKVRKPLDEIIRYENW